MNESYSNSERGTRVGLDNSSSGTRLVALCVIFVTPLALACRGGAGECIDTTVLVPGDGLLSTSEELDTEQCVPGAFAEFDMEGTWAFYVRGGERDGQYAGSVRIAQTCDESVTISDSAGSYEHRVANQDGIFWWRAGQGTVFSQYDAGFLCSRDSEGRALGVLARCSVYMGETTCTSTNVVAKPYGWPEGEGEAEGLALVSEFFDPAWPSALTSEVAVHERVAYLARSQDGIRIIDVSNPPRPVEIAHVLGTSESINEAKVVTNAAGSPFLLAASDASGLIILDIRDPAAPIEVARYHPFANPERGIHTVHSEWHNGVLYAYLADGATNHIFVLDLTDPSTPVEVGVTELESMEAVHAVFAEAGRAYACATFGGLVVLDVVPEPAKATAVGRYNSEGYAHQAWTGVAGGRHFAAFGNEGTGEYLEIIDVDPESPEFMTQIGSWLGRPEVSIHDMVVIEDKIYASNYEDGIRIYDVSNPTNPTPSAHFNTWAYETRLGPRANGALGLHVDIEQGLIYVADSQRGLMLLRIIPTGSSR